MNADFKTETLFEKLSEITNRKDLDVICIYSRKIMFQINNKFTDADAIERKKIHGTHHNKLLHTNLFQFLKKIPLL